MAEKQGAPNHDTTPTGKARGEEAWGFVALVFGYGSTSVNPVRSTSEQRIKMDVAAAQVLGFG